MLVNKGQRSQLTHNVVSVKRTNIAGKGHLAMFEFLHSAEDKKKGGSVRTVVLSICDK